MNVDKIQVPNYSRSENCAPKVENKSEEASIFETEATDETNVLEAEETEETSSNSSLKTKISNFFMKYLPFSSIGMAGLLEENDGNIGDTFKAQVSNLVKNGGGIGGIIELISNLFSNKNTEE